MLERIAAGRTDLIFEYVGQGNASNTQTGGATLLQWCAYYGDVSAIRFLVGRGESLQSLGDDRGLGAAAFHGHWCLCEYLIENGADPNYISPETGETSLHAAASTARSSAVVQVLLRAGADPNRTTTPGKETGAFMRDVRTRGETPLHRAAAFASEETVQLLLDSGAHKEVKDVNGDSPLSWGSWHQRPDSLLRKLCYANYSIRAGRQSMESYLQGTPKA